MHTETMWEFKTARFNIKWEISPCYDLDLSWDDTGETQDNINSGLWVAFDSQVIVECDGREIGADYLGQSIYDNPANFRDHIGMNGKGYGSYFSDMVSEAIKQARQTIANTPTLNH
jgi:hypothetical protein